MTTDTNAIDEEKIKQADARDARNRERDLNDMRYILAAKNGRRFIWKLMSECGIFASSFDGTSRTYFREGERNVGLKILSRLNEADENSYSVMVRESRGGDYDV